MEARCRQAQHKRASPRLSFSSPVTIEPVLHIWSRIQISTPGRERHTSLDLSATVTAWDRFSDAAKPLWLRQRRAGLLRYTRTSAPRQAPNLYIPRTGRARAAK